jgi:hypothetical protein
LTVQAIKPNWLGQHRGTWTVFSPDIAPLDVQSLQRPSIVPNGILWTACKGAIGHSNIYTLNAIHYIIAAPLG